jgi:hypothetical protein
MRFIRILIFGVAITGFYWSCGIGSFQPPQKTSAQTSDSPDFIGLHASEIIFGPELEFTDPQTASRPPDGMENFWTAVREACNRDQTVVCEFDDANLKHFEVKSLTGSGRVKAFPYSDPGIIEVPLAPMTLAEAEASKDLIQRFVYDTAAKAGMTPGTHEYNRWCAHTNMSWPGLRDGSDSDMFLAYFADFNSKPELGLGAFSGDIRNAPVLGTANSASQDAFAALVRAFNQGPSKTAFQLATEINENVYLYNSNFGFGAGHGRYNGFNLSHLKEDAYAKKNYGAANNVRVEQRASYMPLSAEHLISNYKVIAGRFTYLGKQTSIKYSPKRILPEPSERVFKPKGVQEGVTAQSVAKVYVDFLKESGLDAKYHVLHMMNPKVQTEAAKLLNIYQAELEGAQWRAAKILGVSVDTYLE